MRRSVGNGLWALALSALSACSGPVGVGKALGEPTDANPPPLQPLPARFRALPEGFDCNIETINLKPLKKDMPALDEYSDYIVSGWVIDARKHNLGDPVRVRVTALDGSGDWLTGPALRTSRPDVAQSRGGTVGEGWVYENAGFKAIIPLESLPPGRYGLAVVYGDGKPYRCGNGFAFAVASPSH